MDMVQRGGASGARCDDVRQSKTGWWPGSRVKFMVKYSGHRRYDFEYGTQFGWLSVGGPNSRLNRIKVRRSESFACKSLRAHLDRVEVQRTLNGALPSRGGCRMR